MALLAGNFIDHLSFLLFRDAVLNLHHGLPQCWRLLLTRVGWGWIIFYGLLFPSTSRVEWNLCGCIFAFLVPFCPLLLLFCPRTIDCTQLNISFLISKDNWNWIDVIQVLQWSFNGPSIWQNAHHRDDPMALTAILLERQLVSRPNVCPHSLERSRNQCLTMPWNN